MRCYIAVFQGDFNSLDPHFSAGGCDTYPVIFLFQGGYGYQERIDGFAVNLRTANGTVSHHFTERFHRNAIRQANLRSEGVAGVLD